MLDNGEKERKFGQITPLQLFKDIQASQMLTPSAANWLITRFANSPIDQGITSILKDRDLNQMPISILEVFQAIKRELLPSGGNFIRVDRNGVSITEFSGVKGKFSASQIQQETTHLIEQLTLQISELKTDLQQGNYTIYFSEGVSGGQKIVLLEKQEFIYDPENRNSQIARLISRKFVLLHNENQQKELEFTEMWYHPDNPRLTTNSLQPLTAMTILDGTHPNESFSRDKDTLVNRYSDVSEHVSNQSIFAPLTLL